MNGRRRSHERFYTFKLNKFHLYRKKTNKKYYFFGKIEEVYCEKNPWLTANICGMNSVRWDEEVLFVEMFLHFGNFKVN